MEHEIVVRLSNLEVGQVLDGLEIHAQNWRRTADSMEGCYSEQEIFLPLECNDAREANWIADFYGSIIKKIGAQRAEQLSAHIGSGEK